MQAKRFETKMVFVFSCLLDKCHISFKMDDLAVFTKYFYLIYIHIRNRIVAFVFSIPSIQWIIHREILLFKNNFSPTVVNTKRFDPVQSSSPDIEHIIASIIIWREGIWHKYICILADNNDL